MPDERGDVRSGRTGAYDPRTLAPWVVLLLLFALAALASFLLPQTRAEAPDFALVSTGLENGVQGEPVAFRLQDYHGKVVVLDLMAVNCTPCRELTAGVLEPLWEEHGARPDFALLSVDVWADPAMPLWQPGWETDELLRELQWESGVPWRHALDTDRVWQKYDVSALPRLVVVDREGNVAFDEQGTPGLNDVRDAVADALAAV